MLCANTLVKEMHKVESRCDSLLEETAEALHEDVLALMLLATQKTNMRLSIKTAVNRCVFHMKHRERMQSHKTLKCSRHGSRRKSKGCYFGMS